MSKYIMANDDDKVKIRAKVVDNFIYAYMNRTMYVIVYNGYEVASFSDRVLARKWANRIRRNGLIGTEFENFNLG